MDGNGTLYGTLAVRYHLCLQCYKCVHATKDILGVCNAEQGSTRDVLHKFTVDLPKKHGRGGQSALRFARLRMEKRHNYVRKVRAAAETLVYTTIVTFP
jgi:NADH dehydrogenase/NADH:ubiquinone oxidoreductase subunit G